MCQVEPNRKEWTLDPHPQLPSINSPPAGLNNLLQGFHFAGIERVPTNAAPRVKVRWTIGSDALGYLLDEFSPSTEFEWGPRFQAPPVCYRTAPPSPIDRIRLPSKRKGVSSLGSWSACIIPACPLRRSRLSVSLCTRVASPRGCGADIDRVRFSSSRRTRLLALLE